MNGYFLFFIISHAKTVIHHLADLFWAWPSSLDLKRHIILNLIGPGIIIAILSAIMLRSHARRRHALRRFFAPYSYCHLYILVAAEHEKQQITDDTDNSRWKNLLKAGSLGLSVSDLNFSYILTKSGRKIASSPQAIPLGGGANRQSHIAYIANRQNLLFDYLV